MFISVELLSGERIYACVDKRSDQLKKSELVRALTTAKDWFTTKSGPRFKKIESTNSILMESSNKHPDFSIEKVMV